MAWGKVIHPWRSLEQRTQNLTPRGALFINVFLVLATLTINGWERVLPLLLSCPRKRVALEIKRDLLQAECGRPEQSIKLAALVFLVLHDEGVLLTEVRFSKLRSRQYHAVEANFASQV
jgi:hypothetical protein